MNPDFKPIPTFPETIYRFAAYYPTYPSQVVAKDSYNRLWWGLYDALEFAENIIRELN